MKSLNEGDDNSPKCMVVFSWLIILSGKNTLADSLIHLKTSRIGDARRSNHDYGRTNHGLEPQEFQHHKSITTSPGPG